MASLITILLFFVYTWGLGFTATYFIKKAENFLERHLMNLGIGLGVFAILSIILNFFRLPLDWKLFLVLSLMVPAYDLIRRIKTGEITGKITGKLSLPAIEQAIKQIKLTKSNLTILVVLLIFLLSFYIYAKGAFAYPYLEDEDPWGHAVGVKYVSMEKTAYDPPLAGGSLGGFDQVLSYIDPYPPAYDILLGVLHQTSPDIMWTMKFFNALIISLGFIFFYFFAKTFLQNRNKALLATFIFASVPCYLSHFIWAHSLAITLFFPTMYAFEKIKEDKKWVFIAAVLVGAIWVSQNFSQPLELTTMILIYLIISAIIYRQFLKSQFAALFGGILLSLVWFGTMLFRYGLQGMFDFYHTNIQTNVQTAAAASVSAVPAKQMWLTAISKAVSALFDPGGSGARAYTFSDFFYARGENMINAPLGIGIVLSLLTIIGLIFILGKYKFSLVRKENAWLCIALFWLIFAFWGVNGITFPLSIARASFRVWFLLAIPVALIAAEGFYFVKDFFFKEKHLRFLVGIILVSGILFTSWVPKYELNTSPAWPTSGSFGHPAEPYEYAAWFSSIPLNTKVFLYSPRDKLTIGFGAFSCDWCQEVLDFRKKILDKDARELHTFLTEEGYEYFLLNGRMDSKYFNKDYGNETEQLLSQRYNEIINSSLFTPVYQKENMFVVFKVN